MSGTTHEKWVPCPLGELNRLADRLRARHRRRILVPTVAVLCILMIALTGWLLWPGGQSSREYNFAGITCSRVMQLADSYAVGKLSDELHDQVRQHVAQCPHCGPRFKEMGLTVRARFERPPQPTLPGEKHVLLASLTP